jgi:hypothetical protein
VCACNALGAEHRGDSCRIRAKHLAGRRYGTGLAHAFLLYHSIDVLIAAICNLIRKKNTRKTLKQGIFGALRGFYITTISCENILKKHKILWK